MGDTYDETIENLAASAVDTEYGEKIRSTLNREKVLADYAAGKVEYRFRFLRKRNGGGVFWGSTSLRACLNPETGEIILFFYTFDVTEQKMQELLLERIAELDYDVITDVDMLHDMHMFLPAAPAKRILYRSMGNFRGRSVWLPTVIWTKRRGKNI